MHSESLVKPLGPASQDVIEPFQKLCRQMESKDKFIFGATVSEMHSYNWGFKVFVRMHIMDFYFKSQNRYIL